MKTMQGERQIKFTIGEDVFKVKFWLKWAAEDSVGGLVKAGKSKYSHWRCCNWNSSGFSESHFWSAPFGGIGARMLHQVCLKIKQLMLKSFHKGGGLFKIWNTLVHLLWCGFGRWQAVEDVLKVTNSVEKWGEWTPKIWKLCKDRGK